MATYKGIQGYTVQKLSDDPTASESVEGQLWYNSSTGKFKIVTTAAGAWSSGGNINTARYNVCASGASNTAALIFAGYTTPPATYYDFTESYDGTSWTEVADINRTTGEGNAMGFGSQTSALIAGGNPGMVAFTETWDGTSWTEVNNLTTGRDTMKGGGTSSGAGITFGGGIGTPPPANFYMKLTETWDGTSWTEVNNLNIGRQQMGSANQGSSTANLCIAGELDAPYSPRTGAYVESWDGTCWTEVNNVNTARTNGGSAGIQTNALYFGGDPGGQTNTESYDGTSWTEVADIATARIAGGSGGTGASAILAGGNAPPASNLTEEWDDPTYTIKTVTVS
jgi:hypothetical protein